MKIISNYHWHNFLYGYELTEKEKENFDYLDKTEIDLDAFIRYRKRIYSVREFENIPSYSTLAGKDWHGYNPDSFYSGVLIKFSEDGEQYQIATYIS